MKIITATDTDLLHQHSKDNLKGISLQNKVVQDLYLNFPDCIVAGGAPMNHYMGVAARDIDVFCTSEQTAKKIIQFLEAESITKLITGGEVIRHNMNEQDSVIGYPANYNEAVYEFYGNTPSTPKYAFLFNVVVRAVPKNLVTIGRFQLYGLYLETIPCEAQSFCFLEVHGRLTIARSNRRYPRWNSPDNKRFEKLQNKILMLQAGAFRRGAAVDSPMKNVPLAFSGNPIRPSLELLYEKTASIFGGRDIRIHLLTKTGLINKNRSDAPLVSTRFLEMPDQILKEYLELEENPFEFHQEVDKRAAQFITSKINNGLPPSMSFMRLSFYSSFRGSSGSRPQDWVDTWAAAQTVQSGRGADQVVFDEIATQQPDPFGDIGSYQRVFTARAAPPITSFGNAAFFRGEATDHWSAS